MVVERDEVERRPDPDDSATTCSQRVSRSSQSVTYGSTARSDASVLRDCDQLVQSRVELLLRRAPKPLAADRDDLALGRRSRTRRNESRIVAVLGVESSERIECLGSSSAPVLPRSVRTGCSHRSPDVQRVLRASRPGSARRSRRRRLRAVVMRGKLLDESRALLRKAGSQLVRASAPRSVRPTVAHYAAGCVRPTDIEAMLSKTHATRREACLA